MSALNLGLTQLSEASTFELVMQTLACMQGEQAVRTKRAPGVSDVYHDDVLIELRNNMLCMCKRVSHWPLRPF